MLFTISCAKTEPVANNYFPAPTSETRDAFAANGMVAAAHPLASQIGADILKAGGNAFDAAVATAFAINITEPDCSGLGGGGFAMIYSVKDQKSYVIDFREMAPAAAHDRIYVDKDGNVVPRKSSYGWYASGVPGQVAGMAELHKRFGTMTWAELIEPTIKLLESGVPANYVMNRVVTDSLADISNSPSKDFFEKTFLKNGLPIEVGDKYYNPELVDSLRLIQKDGADAFYKGAIADKIAATYAKHANAWITKADLAKYTIKMREPVQGTYRGNYTIVSVPPASSGGITIVEILNILDNFDLRKMGYASVDAVHTIIEAQKLAFADRNQYIADTDFVDVPIAELMSKDFANARAKNIDMTKAAGPYNPGAVSGGSGNTTSFSIIDKDGNMISITQTINYLFGAFTVVEGAGIIMNNQMDDFVTTPGHANSPAAGKRPLSSMSPSLVLKDGKSFATLGSPGAQRIITAVASVLINMIDFDMDMQQANNAPRVHNNNTPATSVEARWPEATRNALIARGHELTVLTELDGFFGALQGVAILPDGTLHGSADPRRGGQAVGY
jgi:gamma-glutamyltranspeptidase/glutathione hydrolase